MYEFPRYIYIYHPATFVKFFGQRAGGTQERLQDTLPDTLPGSESEVEKMKGSQDLQDKPKLKTQSKDKSKQDRKDKKAKKEKKVKKDKKVKAKKEAKRKGSGGAQDSGKSSKSPVARDLREELAAAASPQGSTVTPPVHPPEPQQKPEQEKDNEIGLVYQLSSVPWRKTLQNIMAKQDYNTCLVEVGKGDTQRLLFFRNENLELSEPVDGSDFPLRILRSTHRDVHLKKENDLLETLYNLTPNQLDLRAKACLSHPLFNKYLEEAQFLPNEIPKIYAEFGKNEAVIVEEVWGFECFLFQQGEEFQTNMTQDVPKENVEVKAAGEQDKHPEENAAESAQQKTPENVPKDEVKASGGELPKALEGKDSKDAEKTEIPETPVRVDANLLRPGTMDLVTPPATPIAVEQPLALPAAPQPDIPQAPEATATPGEAEALKEKKKEEERKKKRWAQWARFMRTFEGGGVRVF